MGHKWNKKAIPYIYIIKKPLAGGGGSSADKRTCQPSQPEFNSGTCMRSQDTVHP